MAGHTEAGWADIAWDGRTSDGGNLASGIYLYRVETSTHSMAKKMTLIK
jgi:flagellar hook assembly protein FlgD